MNQQIIDFLNHSRDRECIDLWMRGWDDMGWREKWEDGYAVVLHSEMVR